MVPTRATILAALRTPMPLRSVRVVPDDSTAAAMFAGGFGDATVECPDLGDEVSGQAAQRLEGGLAGPDLAQDVRGPVSRQTARSS
jgi:hypothetical protein